jgi:hypothetical protein
MACALFSLYGYTMFSSVKAMMLVKYHDLKSLTASSYTKDVYSDGAYFQFLKNPQEDRKSNPILLADITNLEAEILDACKTRAGFMSKGQQTVALALDKSIDRAMITMRLKTIEYLR